MAHELREAGIETGQHAASREKLRSSGVGDKASIAYFEAPRPDNIDSARGGEQALVPNTADANRSKNRRVELQRANCR